MLLPLQLLHKFCGEVLPYLEVQKQQTEEDIKEIIEMPNVIGMNVQEAKKVLEELGLEIEINGEGQMVTEQLPKKGIKVNKGTKVTIYVE